MKSGILVLLVLVGACSGGGQATGATTPAAQPAPIANTTPPPASPVLEAELTPAPDDPMAMMQLFSDQICACHDKPCADEVVDHMMSWGQEMAKKTANKTAPVGKDEAVRIATLSERFSKCLSAIASANLTP